MAEQQASRRDVGMDLCTVPVKAYAVPHCANVTRRA
jgi:hypothetical protein